MLKGLPGAFCSPAEQPQLSQPVFRKASQQHSCIFPVVPWQRMGKVTFQSRTNDYFNVLICKQLLFHILITLHWARAGPQWDANHFSKMDFWDQTQHLFLREIPQGAGRCSSSSQPVVCSHNGHEALDNCGQTGGTSITTHEVPFQVPGCDSSVRSIFLTEF